MTETKEDVFEIIVPDINAKKLWLLSKKKAIVSPLANDPEPKFRKAYLRTVEHVLSIVRQWLDLTEGVVRDSDDESHNVDPVDSQAAAYMVGVSEYSLEFYLRHMRYAKLYGFDFVASKSEGFDKLRRFNQ